MALADLVDPSSTAVVTHECQNGVIGEASVLPELAEIARRAVVPNTARIVKAARKAGATVVHCVAARRADGRGSNLNARLFAAVRRSPVQMLPGTDAVRVVDEIGVGDDDLVLSRLHGLGAMGGTDLDPVLRNLGVRTIVVTGVSLNVGVPNLVMDAVNAGYQVVVPRDAVAGVPEEYGRAVIDHTLAYICTLVTTDQLLDIWGT